MFDDSTTTPLLGHVERISRSFHLPIIALPPPYRDWIALSYLALRILDTIEDSRWSSSAAQGDCFAAYEVMVRKQLSHDSVAAWSRGFPSSLTSAEKFLIGDSPNILAELHALPENVRNVLQRTILTMSQGMQVFLADKRQLRSIAELDLYCFFVAGIVAELLVDLLAIAHPRFSTNPDLVRGARQFGVALQKINILHDVDDDRPLGRRYFCNRARVMASLCRNVRGALIFFARLPAGEREFRLFCQLALILGLSSLGETPGSHLADRDRVAHLADRIRCSSEDPAAIERLAHKLCPSLAISSSTPLYRNLDLRALEATAPEGLVGVLRNYFAESVKVRESLGNAVGVT